MRVKSRNVVGSLALVGCLLIVAVAAPAAAGFDEKGTLSADSLVLRNLIGEIEIVGHRGSSFEIEVRVQGDDANPERVRIETTEGPDAEWNIIFPLDESKRFVYPRMQGGSTSFGMQGRSWVSNLFGGNIRVSGSGSGLEIWADVTVKVPHGKRVVVEHGVGRIRATDVDADLDLDSRSGAVEVVGTNGSVSVDTGSGKVSVESLRGNLHIDTGSGKVTIRDCQCQSVHVDTGSGGVELEAVDGSVLYVDTGSGGVRAKAIGADDVTIDTGSGSVTLQLDRMGTGRFEIDTGSGSINLHLPPDASADVEAETGSGGIKLDLAGSYDIRHKDDDEVRVVIGGGAARLVLDTGSGRIRISQ
jgi:hypothetical protein